MPRRSGNCRGNRAIHEATYGHGAPQDGYIDLDELYDYVYDALREVTPHQTPGKWTFGVQGDLVIARRNTPVTKPAALPPDLQQSIDSPLAGVRAGAVEELARLLSGRHQALCVGLGDCCGSHLEGIGS